MYIVTRHIPRAPEELGSLREAQSRVSRTNLAGHPRSLAGSSCSEYTRCIHEVYRSSPAPSCLAQTRSKLQTVSLSLSLSRARRHDKSCILPLCRRVLVAILWLLTLGTSNGTGEGRNAFPPLSSI